MTVKFENVGHSNMCFTAKCKGELTYNWLYKQVSKFCGSKCLDFSYNEEKNEGIVFGGLQTIGKFSIVQEADNGK